MFALIETSLDDLSVCVCVSLQVLGDRWAAICRWTEERWILLQEILLKWQHFTNEQVYKCVCVCVGLLHS